MTWVIVKLYRYPPGFTDSIFETRIFKHPAEAQQFTEYMLDYDKRAKEACYYIDGCYVTCFDRYEIIEKDICIHCPCCDGQDLQHLFYNSKISRKLAPYITLFCSCGCEFEPPIRLSNEVRESLVLIDSNSM